MREPDWDCMEFDAADGSVWTPEHCEDVTDRKMRVYYSLIRGIEITRVESQDVRGLWEPDQLTIAMRNAVMELIQQRIDNEQQEQSDAETERADSLGYN